MGEAKNSFICLIKVVIDSILSFQSTELPEHSRIRSSWREANSLQKQEQQQD